MGATGKYGGSKYKSAGMVMRVVAGRLIAAKIRGRVSYNGKNAVAGGDPGLGSNACAAGGGFVRGGRSVEAAGADGGTGVEAEEVV